MFSLSVECCWDICFFFCQTPVKIFSLYCMNCGVQKHKEISKVEKDIVLRPSMGSRCSSSASSRPSASVAPPPPLEILQDHRPQDRLSKSRT
ncbi:hypothetical protein ZEAMMB73_Zm00001d005832 [Zea mays]|uniref:Uncharacterized protein n=1 Tax=Zea mays TaxID=4577 RepID=A0A1D6ER62_MAIZE|nr:hypothetical protein ZEAMMB73_Zm00001d005832 [Zea mays]